MHAAHHVTRSLLKDGASGFKSAAVGGFPSDHGGLVEVRGAVLALRWVVPAVGRLGAPHFALALPQLGDVALEAEAELRVLSLGCFQFPLL